MASPEVRAKQNNGKSGLLDLIEAIGNRLPDPAMLFVIGAAVVMLLSHVASTAEWSVQPQRQRQLFEPVMIAASATDPNKVALIAPTGEPLITPRFTEAGEPELALTADLREVHKLSEDERDALRTVLTDPNAAASDPNLPAVVIEISLDAKNALLTRLTRSEDLYVLRGDEASAEPITAVSLLTADGIYWCFTSLVDNFINFPPLGVVLVGMLGIGVAERTGLLAAAIKVFALVTPSSLLTPAMIFLGIMSSLGMDAGYVVLPPLAAALYLSVGRSPLVGVAAVFAGVSAGFNANLLVTGLDPMLAEFANTGAHVIDPDYNVEATANWYFMFVSTFVITLAGWWTTYAIVDRRFSKKSVEDGGPDPNASGKVEGLTRIESIGLAVSSVIILLALGAIAALALVPDWPLYGNDPVQPALYRWVEAIEPIIFFVFLAPGVAFGIVNGMIRSTGGLTKLLIESMAAMAPIIVLAFFAGQFIEYFKYSHLDQLLAHTGGQALVAAQLSPYVLLVVFVMVTAVANLFIGSMSAKYAMFAPIFIPMFMLAGISPELTQAAYRIGDSVSNVITPLNSYLIIILVYIQKYVPKAGLGTLISMMLPYSMVFLVVWLIMLLTWVAFGWDLGIGGPLTYSPAG